MERSSAPDGAISALAPAEVYDEQFVPALFAQWGPVVCDAVGVAPGHQVLDVACGTGALSEVAHDRVAPGGSVCGLDANPQMLAVARRKLQDIEWRHGHAESLPFADVSFDRVVSQFGMMFFDDRHAALREMWRVLRPGGSLAIAVWDALDRSPGYAAFAGLLQRLFGEPVAAAFRAPFVLGDANRLLDLFDAADIAGAQVARYKRGVRFKSIGAMVAAEHSCAWTLGGILDDEQFDRLRREAGAALREHVDGSGATHFAMPALIVVAAKGDG
jgi:SAM-dependent methyltransferase